MPVPIVVVELPAAELERPETAALFEACSSALGDGQCVPAGGRDGDASAFAAVSWADGERLKVLVTVGRDRGRNWRSRELVFQPGDAAGERSRTVGFTIASLAVEIEPPSPALEPPSPGIERPAELPAPGRRSLAVNTGVLTGPGLDRGLHRLGASLRGAYFPPRLPLFATVSMTYALRSPDNQGVAVSWLTPGLGAGLALSLPESFSVRVRLEGVVERIRAEADDPFSSRSEQAARSVFGGRGGVELAWPETASIGAVLFTDLTRLAGQTAIHAFGTTAGVAPATTYDFGVALELRLEP
jgi:hypothetical protein